MGLSDIKREDVLSAIAEYEAAGEEKFLERHGFGPSTRWLVRHEGKEFIPKAIVGAAHIHATGDRLSRLSGGPQTNDVLSRLGFEVVEKAGRDTASSPMRVFWVNQGSSYQKGRDSQHIWAPKKGKNDASFSHWTRVSTLQPGEIIVHYSDTKIRAIGRVTAAPDEAEEESPGEQSQWRGLGWRAPVEYFELRSPIRLDELAQSFRQGPLEEGPFDKHGGVKQGYLFNFSVEGLRRLEELRRDNWPEWARTPAEEPIDETDSMPTTAADFPPPSLAFPPELVASYVLGLRTRRFAILTGISGTGKTQLALALAKHFVSDAPIDTHRAPALNGVYRLTVGASQIEHRRFFVPRGLSSRVWAPGKPAPTTALVAYPDGEVEASLYHENARHNLHVALSGELYEWFRALPIGTPLSLRVTNEDLEVGRFVIEPLDEAGPYVGRSRYRVLEVRPDWTDSHALLGFYNPIFKSYQRTPLLDLLLQAREDYDRLGEQAPPNFVVLDEMNLARVEHYFADLLSCLESGEPLKLHHRDVEDEDEEADSVPQELVIPPNVFFTGTVNVDETTHMFSPKVLDRAFVFEFNDVNLVDYGKRRAGETRLPLKLDFLNFRMPSPGDWEPFVALGGFSKSLADLHAVLERHGRHFGYRVANDVARFVKLASEGQQGAATDALDVAVVSKVLPKLVGTQSELEALLVDLFAFATGSEVSSATAISAAWALSNGALKHAASAAVASPMPRTATKLFRMLRRLRERGFASFIE